MIFVCDTHPLVWHLEGNPRLADTARAVLDNAESHVVLPSIVIAEIWYLYQRKRINTSSEIVRSRLLAARNCSIYPLDDAVLRAMPFGLDIHDAIIVATALVYRDVLKYPVRLITQDRAIIESGAIECVS